MFRRIAVAAAAALFCIPANAGSLEPQLQAHLSRSSGGEDVPVIVRFEDGVDLASIRERAPRRRRAKVVAALRTGAETRRRGFDQWLRRGRSRRTQILWAINAVATTLPASRVARLAARPGVASVSLDAQVAPPSEPVVQAAAPEWNISTIRADDLWALGFDGSGRVVGIMDTGVDLQHPDVGPRWRGGANSWFDPYAQHANPYDADGHGTSVAGLILGGDAGGSSIGVAPGARWIGARIFADSGAGSISAIHQAFQWFLDPSGDGSGDGAPDVVNGSWALTTTVDSCNTEFQDDITVLRDAGIAVVISAGNFGPGDGSSVSPGNNAGSFSVGAVDSDLRIASYSSRGPSACGGGIYPQLAAPGEGVRASDLTAGGAFPDSYRSFSGTSASAPHVAGAIALLGSAVGDVPVDTMEAALRAGAADLGASGPDDDFGWGLLDVFGAYGVLSDGSPPPPPPPPPPTAETTFGPVGDARVSSGSPGSNFGFEDLLWVDEDSTTYRSYLKFDLSGVAGPVTQATLRLFVTNKSSDGVGVSLVSSDWNEGAITFDNAPAIGSSSLDSLSRVSAGEWVELDVTAGVAAGGPVSFGLRGLGNDSARFSSREGGDPPELVIATAGDPPPPPPPPPAPSADFSAFPASGPAPLAVSFSDTSADAPTSWSWEFGDGGTSSQQNPGHTYALPGTYTVTLSVGNASGSDTRERTDYVVVEEPSAERVFTPVHDARVNSGSPSRNYGGDASLRIDEDTTDDYSYLKFDLSGLGASVLGARLRIYFTSATDDGAGVHATANDYAGTATPWTENGIDFASAPALGAALDFVPQVNAGQWVEFDVSAAFAGPGIYSLAVVGAGPDGARLSSKEGEFPPELVVETGEPPSLPPTAAFSGAPLSGSAPLTVSFTDQSTGGATAWTWDFGDGNTSSARHPMHVYTAVGTWPVTLTASNGFGADSVTRTDYVTVGAAPSEQTLAPSDDAQVSSGSPGSNFGFEDTLKVDEDSTTYRSYLKFDLSSMAGSVTQATLRLFVTNKSSDGVGVSIVSSDWDEGAITFDDAPAIGGSTLDSLSRVSVGEWIELDVSAGVAAGGPVSFGLRGLGSDSARFDSKEGANPPELVVRSE